MCDCNLCSAFLRAAKWHRCRVSYFVHFWYLLHRTQLYTLISSKTVPPLACYNFDIHELMLIVLVDSIHYCAVTIVPPISTKLCYNIVITHGCQGSHAYWKVLEFPRPGKSWKLKLKVLESPGIYLRFKLTERTPSLPCIMWSTICK